MIKRCAISFFTMLATSAYAGFGGMGNVGSDEASDVTIQEAVFMLAGLAIIYGFMKTTGIGQTVEHSCGTFWGMVVLSIAALVVIGVASALLR